MTRIKQAGAPVLTVALIAGFIGYILGCTNSDREKQSKANAARNDAIATNRNDGPSNQARAATATIEDDKSGQNDKTQVGNESPQETAPFQGVIAPTVRESVPHWPEQPRAPKGAPNVLFVMIDDLGFSQLGCYGAQGLRTPNIDKLADNGLRYNNFHATPLCSPSRAALLTGRNHHSCALGIISEFSTGFPGYNGRMPLSHGMMSEILAPAGWSTFCLGKWHLTPPEDANLAANRRWWPVGRGFDRFYGYLGGTTSEYVPWITQDNHFIQPPGTPEEGYHLLTDMTEKAREYIVDVKHVAPDRPFFMYFCPGAVRAPQHVPQEWSDKYKGVFDKGWDHYREETLKKQIALGICPPGTKLSPRDPSIPVWDELNAQQRKVFARQMEVFAGFVEFVDDHVGQLVKTLEEIGELDNTLIVLTSDNGASIEGGDNGVPNEVQFFNNVQVSLEMAAKEIDEWGGPDSFPGRGRRLGLGRQHAVPSLEARHHPRRNRRTLIVHWPKGIKAKGAIRSQFTHAIDVVPTVLDVLNMQSPASINGVVQAPMEGVSFAATFEDANCQTDSRAAVFRDGWTPLHLPRRLAGLCAVGIRQRDNSRSPGRRQVDALQYQRGFLRVHRCGE